MRCDNCGIADLAPARFTYERVGPEGARLIRVVEGFECPSCRYQLIVGRDAETLSRDWYRLTRRATTDQGALDTWTSHPDDLWLITTTDGASAVAQVTHDTALLAHA